MFQTRTPAEYPAKSCQMLTFVCSGRLQPCRPEETAAMSEDQLVHAWRSRSICWRGHLKHSGTLDTLSGNRVYRVRCFELLSLRWRVCKNQDVGTQGSP